jgi:hypothetical protein
LCKLKGPYGISLRDSTIGWANIRHIFACGPQRVCTQEGQQNTKLDFSNYFGIIACKSTVLNGSLSKTVKIFEY